MPLYEISHATPLSQRQRDQLAESITAIHSTKFAVPRMFINVIFTDSSNTPTYVGGKQVRPHPSVCRQTHLLILESQPPAQIKPHRRARPTRILSDAGGLQLVVPRDPSRVGPDRSPRDGRGGGQAAASGSGTEVGLYYRRAHRRIESHFSDTISWR